MVYLLNNINKDNINTYIVYLLINTDNTNNYTYLGITNNSNRRLRQHNREIKGGAKYTKLFKGDGQLKINKKKL